MWNTIHGTCNNRWTDEDMHFDNFIPTRAETLSREAGHDLLREPAEHSYPPCSRTRITTLNIYAQFF